MLGPLGAESGFQIRTRFDYYMTFVHPTFFLVFFFSSLAVGFHCETALFQECLVIVDKFI